MCPRAVMLLPTASARRTSSYIASKESLNDAHTKNIHALGGTNLLAVKDAPACLQAPVQSTSTDEHGQTQLAHINWHGARCSHERTKHARTPAVHVSHLSVMKGTQLQRTQPTMHSAQAYLDSSSISAQCSDVHALMEMLQNKLTIAIAYYGRIMA